MAKSSCSWMNYQFVPECLLDGDSQKSLARMADECGGVRCPHFRCQFRLEEDKNGKKKKQKEKECPKEISLKCGESCAEFFEKYIKKEEEN